MDHSPAEIQEFAPAMYWALKQIHKAGQAYLPPDGISASEFVGTVLAVLDHPDMVELLR